MIKLFKNAITILLQAHPVGTTRCGFMASKAKPDSLTGPSVENDACLEVPGLPPGCGSHLVPEERAALGQAAETFCDAMVLTAIRTGDKKAFRRLVQGHIGGTVALARLFVTHQSDAECIAREVFLRVWKEARRWRGGEPNFSAWLCRLTLECAMDHRRRMNFPAPDQPGGAHDAGSEIAFGFSPARFEGSLGKATGALSDRQQMALALFYQEGLTVTACAEVMGIKVRAVECLLKHARRELFQSLAVRSEGQRNEGRLKEAAII
ncbi:sigma factor-like helix-turn-helix DNA-binding protein [Aestuariispira insulae]|uniref:RNA polymerase sigma factor (Sigma-70 family) n=1 Tax=Aestuariispira insulae TaxID=1461337 RepID=A0A3D9H2N2_9PROT|nr:sigma factor-like helix-turn-helix DNA-binding protein [Aestuariispira insulae]RED43740.1 RNA polymerase sigma factor (sigma-70 family) [Aestuariispira insulae]